MNTSNNDELLVTVGICVRNSALLIREALESIMAQDFPHQMIELIVVDDGSEDNTLSVVRAYVERMDFKTKVLHQLWQGLGPSRNTVLDNSSGRYVLWIDADMTIPKDHVRKQYEFMEAHPEVGVAKAKYGFSSNENALSFLENASYMGVDQLHGGFQSSSRALGTGGSIYRVSAIRQVGGFDRRITGVGEDMDAEARISRAGWLLYSGTPTFFCERRRDSIKAIWQEGYWHGYGGFAVFRKNQEILRLYKFIPVVDFLAGVLYATRVYKGVRRKLVFLLPLQYTFKMSAWLCGFMRAQCSG